MVRKIVLLLIITFAVTGCRWGPRPTSTPTPQPPTDTPAPPTFTVTPTIALTATPTLTPTSGPFGSFLLGDWQAINITSGSSMTLMIAFNDPDFSFALHDSGAPFCGGTPLLAFNGSGVVTVTSSSTATLSGSGACEVTGRALSFTILVTHDPSADSLTENNGQLWTR